MRKNIVAGNWKMNTTLQEGVALAKEIDAALAGALKIVPIKRKALIQERFLPRWWHRRVLNMLFSVTPNVVHIITKLPKS